MAMPKCPVETGASSATETVRTRLKETWCEAAGVAFTRSRPSGKNDQDELAPFSTGHLGIAMEAQGYA